MGEDRLTRSELGHKKRAKAPDGNKKQKGDGPKGKADADRSAVRAGKGRIGLSEKKNRTGFLERGCRKKNARGTSRRYVEVGQDGYKKKKKAKQ